MKNKYLVFLTLTLLVLIVPLSANADFDAMFNNVDKVNKEKEAKDIAKEAAAKALREKRQKEAQAAAEKRRKEEKIAQEKRRKYREAKQAAIDADKAADKQREQSYEDRVRELKLRSMEASVATDEAKSQRAHDYIDADLKTQNAATDVIQSVADTNRVVVVDEDSKVHTAGEKAEKPSGVMNGIKSFFSE